MLGALDDLDARMAGRFARRPEPLLVLVAVLFLAAAGVHVTRFDQARPADPDEPGAADEPVMAGPAPEDPRAVLPGEALRIGPGAGDALDEYTVNRARALAERAAEQPDEQAAAVVSFDHYLRPDEAEELLGDAGVEILAVRWQLRAAGSEAPSPAPRGRMMLDRDLGAGLAPVWEAEVDQLLAEAGDLEEMADSTDDEEFSSLFTEDAEQLRQAADAAAGGNCACLYAAEVQGTLNDLAVLLGDDAVRLVDAAPAGAGPEVVFVALLPEEREQAGESRQVD